MLVTPMKGYLATIREWSGPLAMVLVLACASAFLLYRLGNEPLQDYDEATYAEVVHEAFINHNYLSYTEGGVPFFKKPPLMFWAMGVSESLLGENTFAMRLPFVLAGIGLIALVMLVALEAGAGAWVAAFAGAVLATTAPFMETARQVRLDVPVAFFCVLALYFALRARANRSWLIGAGVALGLGVLSKSVIALFGGFAVLLVLLFSGRFDVFTSRQLYYGAGAFLVVALPWHLYEWARFGDAFFAQYIGIEVLARTQENLFWTVNLTNADYVTYLTQFTEPWLAVFFIAAATFVLAWQWMPKSIRPIALASIATVSAMVLVFFSAKTKAPTYFVPAYPFAAIAIALAASSLRSRAVQYAAGVLCIALVLVSAQSTFYNAYHYNPYYGIVLHMAKDEQAIGKILRNAPKSADVYAYDNENLGSIEFYSQRLLILALTATSTPKAGSYVTVDTSGLGTFNASYPNYATLLLYKGPQVSLLQITN